MYNFYIGMFGQKVYLHKCSSSKASLQTLVSSTFIHRGVFLPYTVKHQRLEHLWNHENMLETGVVLAYEC